MEDIRSLKWTQSPSQRETVEATWVSPVVAPLVLVLVEAALVLVPVKAVFAVSFVVQEVK